MSNKKTGQHKVYKNTGAVVFGLIPARHNEKGFVEKAGAVLVEAAPAEGKGPNGLPKYNWDRKITFAIGVQDISNLLSENPKLNRLFHEHDKHPKILQFTPGEGKYAGTYMMNLSMGKGSDRATVGVPFDSGEWTVLVRLLVAALPKLIAWD